MNLYQQKDMLGGGETAMQEVPPSGLWDAIDPVSYSSTLGTLDPESLSNAHRTAELTFTASYTRGLTGDPAWLYLSTHREFSFLDPLSSLFAEIQQPEYTTLEGETLLEAQTAFDDWGCWAYSSIHL